jgi:tripartite-type tricarboxylate transporter receptor subunit TctC
MQDLIAGRIDYQCPLVALALPHIESGQAKAVAALSARRSASLPRLATAHEQGLAGFEVSTWNALFLPKGTPAAIVRRLHDAADAAIERPDIQERLRQIGVEPTPHEDRSPESLQQLVGREISKWSGAIKAAGLAAQ